MKMRFLGAAGQVTGSGCLLEFENFKCLVDFGQFQGASGIDTQNFEPLDFNPSDIDAVILTHAHIDHSGRLPLLTKAGFTGKIYCTYPTMALAEILLKDSGKIHEEENIWDNRKRERAGLPTEPPLFSVDDAETCISYLYPIHYHKNIELASGITAHFIPTGHLLGSASIKLTWTEAHTEKSIIFSGDIGTSFNPLLNPPAHWDRADTVVMESTYAGRTHEGVGERVSKLASIIDHAFAEGGTVIIPAFSVGRTQEIVYLLKTHYAQVGRMDDFLAMPIYVDSPMAIEATRVFRQQAAYLRPEIEQFYKGGIDPLKSDNIHYVKDHQASMALNHLDGPKIIISASGMCEAGRIRHHLKHYLWRPSTRLIFIGYQAEGTLGRALKDGVKLVHLFNDSIKVSAIVHSLEGFSGHGDEPQLKSWLKPIEQVKKVILNHGEPDAMHLFKETLEEEFGLDVSLAKINEPLIL